MPARADERRGVRCAATEGCASINSAIAALLSQFDRERALVFGRARKLVLIFNDRLGRAGHRKPEAIVAYMGASGAHRFRTIERICALLASDKEGAEPLAPVPQGWDYRVHADGRVTLIAPKIEPIDPGPVQLKGAA